MGRTVDREMPKRRDLSDVAGTWIEDPEVDRALEEQRMIVEHRPDDGASMTPNLHSSGDLTREDLLRRLRENYPELSGQFGVRRIGLFGSFANETANAASDVDLIVDFDRPIGLRFVELVEYLETLLGRRVDVLTSAGLRGIRLPAVAKQIEESVVHV
jgi:predicted nucleotidyltransferase